MHSRVVLSFSFSSEGSFLTYTLGSTDLRRTRRWARAGGRAVEGGGTTTTTVTTTVTTATATATITTITAITATTITTAIATTRPFSE